MWSVGNEAPSQCNSTESANLSCFRTYVIVLTRRVPSHAAWISMARLSTTVSPRRSIFPVSTTSLSITHTGIRDTAAEADTRFGDSLYRVVAGVYMFPMELKAGAKYPNHQSSGYDTEFCSWSNIPDVDFDGRRLPRMIGQFVWTGFDYLGEPSPYDTDSLPNHSSVFGIIDLASLPKDRYYLYRSQWNKRSRLSISFPLNWKGREGEKTPVMVYTSYPSAELIVNGKSYGIKSKGRQNLLTTAKASVDVFLRPRQGMGRGSRSGQGGHGERYRLVWDDVVYQPE